MDFVALAKEKTHSLCDNLQQGYNQVLFTIEYENAGMPAESIDMIMKDTFVNEMEILHPELVPIYYGVINGDLMWITYAVYII